MSEAKKLSEQELAEIQQEVARSHSVLVGTDGVIPYHNEQKLLAHIAAMEAETNSREKEIAQQISISFMSINDNLLAEIGSLSRLLSLCLVALEYDDDDHEVDIFYLIAEIKRSLGVSI